MKRMYRARVTILLNVEDWASACDALSETLRKAMHDENNAIFDWQHTTDADGGDPVPVLVPDDYEIDSDNPDALEEASIDDGEE